MAREFIVSEQGVTLAAEAVFSGGDLTVAVYGGQRPHVGSVSLAVPRQSLTGDGTVSATVSTVNVTGHKDDEIGNLFAARLAARYNCVCAVTCGVHIDNLTADGIARVMALAGKLLDALLTMDAPD